MNVAIIMLFSYFFAQVMPVSDNPAWLIFLSQTILLTFLLLLFGEILPKVYASHHALSFSRTVSPVMKLLTHIFHPFILLLVKGAGAMNWIFATVYPAVWMVLSAALGVWQARKAMKK